MKNFIKLFISLKTTVVCMFLLGVLIFWGTVYQAEHGLFLAQQRFFDSWIILAGGVIPFPGAKIVLWLLGLNIAFSLVIHFRMGIRMIGVILVHVGLIMMLVGGFVTQLTGQEAYLSLAEGSGSNVISDYRDWEVAIWQGSETERLVHAVDVTYLNGESGVNFEELGLDLSANLFYKNCKAFTRSQGMKEGDIYSPSGIFEFEEQKPDNDPQKDVPGMRVLLETMNKKESAEFLLYGSDIAPAVITLGDESYYVSLRRKRYPIPLFIRLIDFKKAYYPGDQIAKEFASLVEVTTREDNERQTIIEMNKPFRFQGYTFYQASFAEDNQGSEISTFAVTLNYGRLLPYFATGITGLGLVIHFLMVLYFNRATKRAMA